MKRFYILTLPLLLCFACGPTNPVEDPEQPETPQVREPGPGFAVTDSTRVFFSPGNLQYHPLNDTWRFAENQYDAIGADNRYIAPDYDGWVDLFGWGTGDDPTLATNKSADYASFVDWGKHPISNDTSTSAKPWRTITDDEWTYIWYNRPNADRLQSQATVHGVHGYIFLPDDWSDDYGLPFEAGACNWTRNNYYMPSAWEQMEAHGAIFLPVTGLRDQNFPIQSIDGTLEDRGFYWSATYQKDYPGHAWNFHFAEEYAGPDGSYDTFWGQAVRLVKDAQ